MIDRVKIQNYKSLKDVEMTFDSRLTVLVGANGSGKSSVLRCIDTLGSLTEYLSQKMWNRLRSENRRTNSADVYTRFPQNISLYELKSDGIYGMRYTSAHVKLSDNQGKKQELIPQQLIAITPEAQQSALTFDDAGLLNSRIKYRWELTFAPTVIVRLDAQHLAKPSQLLSKMLSRPMTPNGYGLASQLAQFVKADRSRFDKIETIFRQMIPSVRAIRLRDVHIEGSEIAGDEIIFDLPNRKGVPASQMSDGTLYALGLIVKILDPQRPKTLLIDDIDHGFHPKAQTQLVELIKKLLVEFPDLQIVATSHSPYILSGLEWNEVRVLNLQDDGTTVIRPLTDHPKYAKWHDTMTPGEFWSHAGEDWVSEPDKQPREAAA